MSLNLSRGYSSIREKVTKSARYMRACENCKFYFQTTEDEEEVCQNPEVLEFDICQDGDRVYCAFWKGIGSK